MNQAVLDAALDASLDDLADLPENKPYPAGCHLVDLSLEARMVNDKPAISCNFTYVEPVELGDPTATPPKAGDRSGFLMLLENEFGQGQFKEIGKALMPILGIDSAAPGSRRELVEKAKNVRVKIISTVRKGKEGGEFLNVKSVAVA